MRREAAWRQHSRTGAGNCCNKKCMKHAAQWTKREYVRNFRLKAFQDVKNCLESLMTCSDDGYHSLFVNCISALLAAREAKCNQRGIDFWIKISSKAEKDTSPHIILNQHTSRMVLCGGNVMLCFTADEPRLPLPPLEQSCTPAHCPQGGSVWRWDSSVWNGAVSGYLSALARRR